MCPGPLDRAGQGCQRYRMRHSFSIVAGLALVTALGQAKDFYTHTWTKHHVTPHFWAEGGAAGDFNRDGHADLVVGPYWYAGPDYKQRHEFYPATESFMLKGADGKETAVPGFAGALSGRSTTSDLFRESYSSKIYTGINIFIIDIVDSFIFRTIR